MRYLIVVAILLTSLTAVSVNASEKDLALQAAVTMEDAIKTAVSTVPGGKPYEVKMSKKKGQVVYEVEIVDASKNGHKIYVDAQNGKLVVEQK